VQAQRAQWNVHPDSEVRQILSPRVTASRGRPHHGSAGRLQDTISPGTLQLHMTAPCQAQFKDCGIYTAEMDNFIPVFEVG